MATNFKICLVASAGGHLSQLLKLEESWKGYEVFFVTTSEVVKDKLQKYGRIYIVGECNREHPFQILRVFGRCIQIARKERPEVIISTGAAPGLLMCISGKFVGAKIVWIDSIANVEKLSLSGRIVKPIADLFLTQWPEIAKKYENVEYIGTII